MDWLGGGMIQQLTLIAGFALISGLIDLPLTLYQTFVIEERFGFNKITAKLWLADMLKSTLMGAVIGLPIAAMIMWLMGSAGRFWWLWAWCAWMGFNLLLLLIYPTFIAPLFNKFQPLEDESLKTRVTALMQRCGFAAKGHLDPRREIQPAVLQRAGVGRRQAVVGQRGVAPGLVATFEEEALVVVVGQHCHPAAAGLRRQRAAKLQRHERAHHSAVRPQALAPVVRHRADVEDVQRVDPAGAVGRQPREVQPLRQTSASRRGLRPSDTAPSNVNKTADGQWMVLVGPSDPTFVRLCRPMDRPDPASEASFSTYIERTRHRLAIDPIVSAWCARLSLTALSARFDQEDVPYSKVHSIADVVAARPAGAPGHRSAAGPGAGRDPGAGRRATFCRAHARAARGGARDRAGQRGDLCAAGAG